MTSEWAACKLHSDDSPSSSVGTECGSMAHFEDTELPSEHIIDVDALVSLHWLRVQEHRHNDPQSCERQCTSVPAYLSLYFTLVADVPSRQIPVDFLQPTCTTAVQRLHRRQTSFSSFRSQLLEQSFTTHDLCTVARDIQTAS